MNQYGQRNLWEMHLTIKLNSMVTPELEDIFFPPQSMRKIQKRALAIKMMGAPKQNITITVVKVMI